MEEERLQKYLAECGVASRRKCEEFIQMGRVFVNGQKVTELGTKITPNKDIVEMDGKIIKKENKVNILLNKPVGYVTSVTDDRERKTVMDLLEGVTEKVVPVGRLDMFTSGLLLLSNDGDFIYKVTHPKHEINKTYTVTIKGIITKEEVQKLQKGVDIGEYITNLESNYREDEFVLGFEESYGYLIGTHVRDKDATVASMFICEVASSLKNQGKTIVDRLNEIYDEFGYSNF